MLLSSKLFKRKFGKLKVIFDRQTENGSEFSNFHEKFQATSHFSSHFQQFEFFTQQIHKSLDSRHVLRELPLVKNTTEQSIYLIFFQDYFDDTSVK